MSSGSTGARAHRHVDRRCVLRGVQAGYTQDGYTEEPRKVKKQRKQRKSAQIPRFGGEKCQKSGKVSEEREKSEKSDQNLRTRI